MEENHYIVHNYSFMVLVTLVYRLQHLKECRRHKIFRELPLDSFSINFPCKELRLDGIVSTAHYNPRTISFIIFLSPSS
jgi:hypothetical protein